MTTKQVTIGYESKEDFESARCDLTIDTTTSPGTVRLSPSVLVQDEIGNGLQKVLLSDTVRAKKELILESAKATWVQVITFGGPAKISINGHEAEQITHQEDGGWHHADVPADWLRPGVNEIVLWGGGELWISPSFSPNRSALSTDGGRTWDYAHVNAEATLDGEYMVKLRLGRHPRGGSITSAPIDLAGEISDSPIAPRIAINAIAIDANTDEPNGTQIIFAIRGGSTPAYTPQEWSGWHQPNKFLDGNTIAPDRIRYVQWRACLSSERPLQTPVLHSVAFSAKIESLETPPDEIEAQRFDNETIVRGGVDFVYQPPSDKLNDLRTRWPLEYAVQSGRDELEKFKLLREWVCHQWPGWTGHRDRQWDTIDILSAPVDDRGMCVHFGIVFVQCALALGYTARTVILNHHFIAEIWSNQLKKWICMDAGPGGKNRDRSHHYELDGIAINTLEVHTACRRGESDKAQRIAPNPADNEPIGTLGETFCRFLIPMRNNYLDVQNPCERSHGCTQYHYDGYLLWEDDVTKLRSPEYSMQTSRRNDLYWTLNQAELFLQHGESAGEVLVQMNTVTPNFKAFACRIDGGAWIELAAEHVWRLPYDDHDRRFLDVLPHEAVERSGDFAWRLHDGENTLEIKPINAFEIEGITSHVTLRYTPESKRTATARQKSKTGTQI